MSEPDLFVVCKSCGSEVSPYVTECPYCGQRLRKRAPRLDRDGSEEPEQSRRPGTRSLPRLRRDEIPGIAPETRPYAVMALIALSLLATLVLSAGEAFPLEEGAVYGPDEGDWWRLLVSPLLHENPGYQFVTLVATGVFGTLLERRFGWLAVLGVFFLAGAAGAALAVAVGMVPALGANGAALGLLCAWLVDDRLAARRGEPRDSDLLGVFVCAVVLVLLAVAEEDASLAAAVGGATAGAALGLALSALRRTP